MDSKGITLKSVSATLNENKIGADEVSSTETEASSIEETASSIEQTASSIEEEASSTAEIDSSEETLKDPFSRLDIRVGKIVFIQDHVVKKKTYVNHVLYNDHDSKAAIARIKGPYNKKSLKKKMVIVVLNVHYKVKYFESEAFILFARDKKKNITELLEPPTDSEVGDRVIAPGIPFVPMIQMPYIEPMGAGKQVLRGVTRDMRVDSEGYATYKGIRLRTVMEGMITAPTARECGITR